MEAYRNKLPFPGLCKLSSLKTQFSGNMKLWKEEKEVRVKKVDCH